MNVMAFSFSSLLLCSVVLLLLVEEVLVAGDGNVGDFSTNLFTFLNEHETLCFLEEVSQGTTWIAEYYFPEATSKELKLFFLDPSGNEKVFEKAGVGNRRFAFSASVSGEHKFCVVGGMQKPWPASSRSSKFYVAFDMIAHSEDLQNMEGLISNDQVKSLDEELRILANMMDLIIKDMELAKEKEAHFRNQSEKINSNVVIWSVLQTIFLISVAVMQSMNLKNFFKSRKIV